MKVVVLDGYTVNPGDVSWDPIASQGELTVYDRTPVEDTALAIARIGDAPCIFVNMTPVNRAVLEGCPGLRFVGVLSTGYNVVDVKAAADCGVTVCNVPAYGTYGVAQYALAHLLTICSRVEHHAAAVRAGRWSECSDFCFWDYPIVELKDKVLGVVGFGRIGKQMGRLGAALGMQVLAYDAYPDQEGRSIGSYVTLEELLGRADVVSLHCNLTEETAGMIGAAAIAKMKDGAILINTGRGQLIDEDALAAALRTGKVYAAGLDVVSEEPIRPDNPLLDAPNCFITPHISWAARESRRRLMGIAAENLRRFLAGEPINVVTP